MFKGGRSPSYADVNSYTFKQWFDAVWRYLLSITNIVTSSASITIDEFTFYVRADATAGAITITLPHATDTGRQILIKKIDSGANAVTVSRSGSDTIEGSTTVSLSSQWDSIQVIANGQTTWEKM